MLNIFYTGAKAANLPQLNPRLSLGGYVSNTPIPNGRINNLFDDCTYYDVQSGFLTSTKAIVFKNTGADPVTITIGILKAEEDPDYIIEMAFVSINEAGQMESIANTKDLPYVGDFEEADVSSDDFSNALELPAVPAGESIGVWFKRTIRQSVIANMENVVLDDIEPKRNFTIKIQYQ